MKYIANFKKIVNGCIRKGWLSKDPFLGFKMTKHEVIKEALTEQELTILDAKSFPVDRLNFVKDIFLFSCYTGLAFASVKKLKRSEIGPGIDGNYWIFTTVKKRKLPRGYPFCHRPWQLLKNTKSAPAASIPAISYRF